MGMLGILSTVTLRVVDTFYVKLSQTRIPTKDWKRFLREGEMSYMLWFFPEGEKIGPVHEILMSFEAIGPIAGAEWAVPAPRFDAAMADLEREMANGLYLPAPVWLKKVKPETAWLSAADEECVQCGIYHNVNPGTPWHVREMVTRVERLMLRHGGRPHLGKLIYLDPADLKSVYPNWQKFDAPRREMDPTGVFWTVL